MPALRPQLACKIIEQNPNALSTINYEKLSESWPCENARDRPGVPTLKKQVTQLRKDAKAPASSATTPHSATKSHSSAPTKTPTKRAASSPKTPASKKRKFTTPVKSSQRKADSEESEIEISSSDEDQNMDETGSENEDDAVKDEKTPKAAARRVLPTRSRKATAKSYAVDSDSESKDAGARSDSDEDDEFDSSQEKDDGKTGLPRKMSGRIVCGHGHNGTSGQRDLQAEEDDVKSVATSTHTGWKSAQEEFDDDDDDEN